MSEEWHPEVHSNYDIHMSAAGSEVFTSLVDNQQARLELFRDPRPTHQRLYAALTPPEHPEYAGTYRGTPGTSLSMRRAGVPSFTGQSAPIAFTEPADVAAAMSQYLQLFEAIPATSTKAFKSKLDLATLIFVFFGKIHPFLDGNGHVQRLIFVAACSELGLRLASNWTIHPRPYDIDFAKMLEAYHLHGGDRTDIAHYLGSFVVSRH
jgi:fido (protein-threonine AMPylation protein)